MNLLEALANRRKLIEIVVFERTSEDGEWPSLLTKKKISITPRELLRVIEEIKEKK